MLKASKQTLLMILDGFGVSVDPSLSAISKASKPNLDKIIASYPITTIGASGEKVGLPAGQMGNSEVGHLNIGAGRIIYQDLTRISKDIQTGAFYENPALNLAMDNVMEKNSHLHLMGLVSDGGVHSHMDHLFALINMALAKGIRNVSIHCFLDGRDVAPDSAYTFLAEVEEYIAVVGLGKVSTISGRYYAMDRDSRWERVELAYDALTGASNESLNLSSDSLTAIQDSYKHGINDEFVVPTVFANSDFVKDHDSVIMFNFRPDRAREITRAFIDSSFTGFERKVTLNDLTFVTMTEYDKTIENVAVAFPKESPKNTLGEYTSALGLKQLRIAETEKYAHVTFFFNGGIEPPYPGEDRELIPSPKVATYDMQPEMSALEVTDKVIEKIKSKKYDLIILNYANPDMVGHTGDMNATIKAIETVDFCVGKVVDAMLEANGQILLTADHGNAEEMIDSNGNIVTAHSLNNVPLINISSSPQGLEEGGSLCDIAPTLLDMMGLEKPLEMTGRTLLKKRISL